MYKSERHVKIMVVIQPEEKKVYRIPRKNKNKPNLQVRRYAD